MYDTETEKKHTELITLLEEVLGDPRKLYSSKGQVSFDCPTCSGLKGLQYDGKGNLEVNYDMGVYNCWSCAETHGTKGRIYNLFKEFANSEQLKRFIAGKFVFTGDFYESVKDFTPKETLKLPEEYFTLIGKQKYSDFKPALNYLYNRGITDEIIDKYKIGFCLTGKYQNRIVIPSYDKDDNLNYFITRSISKYTKKFKYLNPDADKTQIIFNEKLIDWDKPVFLVEGAFDHIVTPNSIPLLGKKLYDKLFELIYFNARSYVIIVLDPDAYDDAVKIFNKLNAGRLRKKILLNLMPKEHDVSSFNENFGQEELKKWLKEKNYKLND
jgi:DNA primase